MIRVPWVGGGSGGGGVRGGRGGRGGGGGGGVAWSRCGGGIGRRGGRSVVAGDVQSRQLPHQPDPMSCGLYDVRRQRGQWIEGYASRATSGRESRHAASTA